MGKMKEVHAKMTAKKQKSPMEKFTIMDFMKRFPTDESCLEFIKNKRWPDGIYCEKCEKVTGHSFTASRRCYTCHECGLHVHPTADTIFHKSSTPLTTWFYVAYLMAQTRGGISAKQIERETGVTYKTAWRMCKLIREALDEKRDIFGGNGSDVEVDESYFGPKSKEGKRGRGSENKVPVVGIVERGGRIFTQVIPDVKKATLQSIIEDKVQKGTTVNSDELWSYNGLGEKGYEHKQINHSQKVYVVFDTHTNTIEGFWGNFKNGVTGVHHHISNKYLNLYLAEHGFRYSHRNDVKPMFLSFLDRMALETALPNE